MRIVIAIPALNEAGIIARTVETVRRFADVHLRGHEVTIVVADNGSTDDTAAVLRQVRASHRGVEHIVLKERGKGLAVRHVWRQFASDVYVFMDADLAVDLSALPSVINEIQNGAALAIGSRYHPDSKVKRSPLRRVLSNGYRCVLGAALDTDITDLPCGFKAVSREVVTTIMPSVRDNRWFFDTELVIRAERAGHLIIEVPVDWRDAERESKVKVASLVPEYLKSVFGLRRAIGPRVRPPEPEPIKELWSSITPREKRFATGVAAFIAILGLIPPIVALLWAKQHGWEWTGRMFLAPGDTAVYLNDIAQIKAGRFALANGATTEALVPVFNWFWLLVGWLARVMAFTPLAAYHISRTLLIFPLGLVAYACIAYTFRQKLVRASAYVLFMLGSGVGLYFAPFLERTYTAAKPHEWPIDFWVAEANAFMSMIYSPHFVASWIFFLAAAVLLQIAYERENPRYGAYAGIAALILFNFHPFHAPTLWLVAGIAVAASTVIDGFSQRRWKAFLLFLLWSFPSVAYHYWLTHFTANAEFMLDNNVNVTPSLPFIAMGFGAFSLLAIAGWRLERQGRTNLMTDQSRRFLAAWALAQLAVVYFPFVFQRRLLEGLQYPLVLLSIPAVFVIAQHRWFQMKFGIVAAFLIVAGTFFPSTFATMQRSIDNSRDDLHSPFFFSSDESAVLEWIRTSTPEDAVFLSTTNLGNDTIGWGERTSYAAHWANTVDLGRKQLEVRDFFVGMTDAERLRFIRRTGVDFVLVGPVEKRFGGDFSGSPWLWQVFTSNDYTVYQVMP